MTFLIYAFTAVILLIPAALGLILVIATVCGIWDTFIGRHTPQRIAIRDAINRVNAEMAANRPPPPSRVSRMREWIRGLSHNQQIYWSSATATFFWIVIADWPDIAETHLITQGFIAIVSGVTWPIYWLMFIF